MGEVSHVWVGGAESRVGGRGESCVGGKAEPTVSNDCSLKPYTPPLLLLFIQLPSAKMTCKEETHGLHSIPHSTWARHGDLTSRTCLRLSQLTTALEAAMTLSTCYRVRDK